jgi:hypothetical protein
MQKIFIHIGHGKTGTTSLQAFLHAASASDSCPFLYPSTCLIHDPPGHHELFCAGFFPAAKWKAGQDRIMCQALYNELRASNKATAIISSEVGLATLREPSPASTWQTALFQQLRSEFEVIIVYYVRNQLQHVESAFYTFAAHNRITPDAENFRCYVSNRLEQFDFFRNMETYWEPIFGRNNILSKAYHPDNLVGADIVSDFFALTALNSEELPGQACDRLILMNRTPQYQIENRRGRLITAEIRQKIIDRFRESNVRYAAKYLGESCRSYLMDGFD